MTTRAKWTMVWAGWAAYFAVAEYVAMRADEYDAPLTAHLRYMLGCRRQTAARTAGQVAYVAGMLLLAAHLYKEAEEAIASES